MPLTNELRDDILASVPSLRAFAISLSGNGDRADAMQQPTQDASTFLQQQAMPTTQQPNWGR